jgi:ribulose-5-phosphate 4-epimerase/fuculose-1-phosphate aldolase
MKADEFALLALLIAPIAILMVAISYRITRLRRSARGWPSISARIIDRRLISDWSPECEIKVAYLHTGNQHEVWVHNPSGVPTSKLNVGDVLLVKVDPELPRRCAIAGT